MSFDTLFYTMTTSLAYYLFKDEPWFPSIIGGAGKCTSIYDHYPDWPVQKRTDLEVFFMIQLGVHVLSVFEMVVIKRSDRKFYEYLLHHFMAASLILFSMMCNEITAGTMILIVHDFSDIFIAMTRMLIDLAIPKVNNQIMLEIRFFASTWYVFNLSLDHHAYHCLSFLSLSQRLH